MTNIMNQPEWLKSYASDFYKWHKVERDGQRLYWRRQGTVEQMFDTDGTDFEGRADIHTNIQLEIQTSLDKKAVRQKIINVWSVFRQQHILLSTKALNAAELLPGESNDRIFVFTPAKTLGDAVKAGTEHVIFVEDKYPRVNGKEFYRHLMNTGRALDSIRALSRLYVLPIEQRANGPCQIQLILVVGHQVSDGLTIFRWTTSFTDLLNMTNKQLDTMARQLCNSDPSQRLPPAQESLYPPMAGSPARQRWSWLITRILRHVRKPPPASFQNPLRRDTPLTRAQPFPPKYAEVLNYERTPPLNSHRVAADLSKQGRSKLASLCRQAKISVGSGLFTLVGMVMMQLEERRHPDIPLDDRLPFVGSFPVNPRPFLTGPSTAGKEESLMLAFSDGIVLPFLPSSLDFEGRFKLLSRLAHRQLRQYQKRKPSPHEQLALGSRSPTHLLPNLYLWTMERLETKRQPSEKRGWNIQGAYPATFSSTLATCGISSVGDRSMLLATSAPSTTTENGQDEEKFTAKLLDVVTVVRPRDGEFLVGAMGDSSKDTMSFSVSYDGCAIDPARAEQWKILMETILEEPPRESREVKL